MSLVTEDLAIVLRSVQYEERHKIITAITEKNGRITAIAKNAIQSRRFGGCLELFTASTWRISKKPNVSLFHLEETLIKKEFSGIRKNLELLTLASVLNEILLKLTLESEPCLDLFKLHVNALQLLEECSSQKEISPLNLVGILNSYLAKILQWNGTQPFLLNCIGCQQSLLSFTPKTQLQCHISRACWTCPDCRTQNKVRRVEDLGNESLRLEDRLVNVTQSAMGDFYLGLTHPIRATLEVLQGDLEDRRMLFHLLISLLTYHVPGFDRSELKSLKLLEVVSNPTYKA